MSATCSSDFPKEDRCDQEVSDSPQGVLMGSGQDSKELSSDSGHNHLARDLVATLGKAGVKIPGPKKRRGKAPKLPIGASRLAPDSICHSCRTTHNLCVRCFACSVPFCERCLNVRHGENFHEVSKPDIEWVCPRCRRGCGHGCDRICCTCSRCCKLKTVPALRRGEGQQMIKEARSAGWNLHDYQIHLQTMESKREIANRKLSFGWAAEAKANMIMHSNAINNGTDHPPMKREGRAEKGRTTLHQVDKTSCDKKTGLNKINENDSRPDRSNDVIDPSYEGLSNSLVPYGDMASHTFLMSLWFNKEKDLTGNQMSITLTDGEKQLKNSIEKRSHAGTIAHEFNPAKLKSLPRKERESRKEKLQEHLRRELAEYVVIREKTRRPEEKEVDTRLSQIFEEVDQQRTKDYLEVKGYIDLYIERMKAVVGKVCSEIDS